MMIANKIMILWYIIILKEFENGGNHVTNE